MIIWSEHNDSGVLSGAHNTMQETEAASIRFSMSTRYGSIKLRINLNLPLRSLTGWFPPMWLFSCLVVWSIHYAVQLHMNEYTTTLWPWTSNLSSSIMWSSDLVTDCDFGVTAIGGLVRPVECRRNGITSAHPFTLYVRDDLIRGCYL